MIPEDLNDLRLRITLESVHMMTLKPEPSFRSVNGATVEYEGETKTGRPKWIKALPGNLIADEEHPEGGMSYPDLLRSLANVLEQQANGVPITTHEAGAPA